ncbi:hypothetical protein EON64_15745 [archaeon]|nr:MAG: hypothetical protein EON64_15745 [archaeon]
MRSLWTLCTLLVALLDVKSWQLNPSIKPSSFRLKYCVRNAPVEGNYCPTLFPNGKIDEITGWHADFYPQFLQEYWQKKPLLVRQAIPNIITRFNISEETIFELAQCDEVESRVIRHSQRQVGLKWTKDYGAFTLGQLSALPASNWTLLVQEGDHHLPLLADLWDTHFSLLPQWRRDDIMLSYSAPGGNIGAHVDNYDVFLLQAR